MAYRVEWSPRAVEDLEAIAQYIAAVSSAYAAAVVQTILTTTRKLSPFPFSGRVVPGSAMRVFASGSPTVTASSVENETVTIAAVIHGKRLLDVE